MMKIFKRGKGQKFSTAFCVVEDCATEGANYTPFKVVWDDQNGVTLECAACGEVYEVQDFLADAGERDLR